MFLTLVLATGLVSLTAGQNCPPIWTQQGNYCYYFIANGLNWFEADQYCTFLLPGTYKSHLVSIETSSEDQFIRNHLSQDPGLKDLNYWTSGEILDRREGFRWAATRQKFGYTNWAPDEPDGSGDCVQIWGEFNYYWDDSDCWSPNNFICKVAANETLAAIKFDGATFY